MRFKALIWDLDGTLIDSPKFWQQAYIETFKQFGLSIDDMTFRRLYGTGKAIEDWLVMLNQDPALAVQMRPIRDAEYCRILREQVEFFDDAKEVLEELEGKIPMGMVTGSWRTYIDATETRLPLSRYAKIIITEDDMGEERKPHPRGLLLAATALNTDPNDCIYIGDQLFDMQAARAAGMTSCLIPRAYTPEEAAKQADMVVNDLREISTMVDI